MLRHARVQQHTWEVVAKPQRDGSARAAFCISKQDACYKVHAVHAFLKNLLVPLHLKPAEGCVQLYQRSVCCRTQHGLWYVCMAAVRCKWMCPVDMTQSGRGWRRLNQQWQDEGQAGDSLLCGGLAPALKVYHRKVRSAICNKSKVNRACKQGNNNRYR